MVSSICQDLSKGPVAQKDLRFPQRKSSGVALRLKHLQESSWNWLNSMQNDAKSAKSSPKKGRSCRSRWNIARRLLVASQPSLKFTKYRVWICLDHIPMFKAKFESMKAEHILRKHESRFRSTDQSQAFFIVTSSNDNWFRLLMRSPRNWSDNIWIGASTHGYPCQNFSVAFCQGSVAYQHSKIPPSCTRLDLSLENVDGWMTGQP